MVEPKLYRNYVTYDSKGRPMMYVKMLKELYVLMGSVLLFYLKVVKDLQAYVFELNAYDACGKQDDTG